MAGFTMLFDFIINHYVESPTVYGRAIKPVTIAMVYGVVYRFCCIDKENPRCEASSDSIGERCGLDESVVRRCLTALVSDGWLDQAVRPGRTSIYRMSARSMEQIGHTKKKASRAVVYDDRP